MKIKDTHREKGLSNETPTLTKSLNMEVWIAVTSNKLFIRGFKLKQNFQKNKVVPGKTSFLMIGSFCILHSICRNTGF